MHKIHPSCRSCGASDLQLILSLGRIPLANALLTAEQLDQSEATYPLEVVFCLQCALVQITETVPPEKLFQEYAYFSSFSDTMLHHAKETAEQLIMSRGLDNRSLVIEIGSNDGYLLQYYQRHDIPVLGIEPAVNIARVAREERGIPTLCAFFNAECARQLRQCDKRADIIHANNVLAHVADLNGVVAGIGLLLKDGGIASIEVPYVRDLIEQVEFDTIYHEHLCYFSLTSLERLFRRHGLYVADVEHLPIHGGSLRVFVSKGNGMSHGQSSTVQRLRQDELAQSLDRAKFYQDFGGRVERLRNELVTLLANLKSQGKRLAAYGAAAKGSVLLNYCGIGRETLEFVVDRNPVKQGHYTPGTHLPIYAPEKLRHPRPDYVLLLTWNFAAEILAQQAEFRRCGGRFIIPIPEPGIV